MTNHKKETPVAKSRFKGLDSAAFDKAELSLSWMVEGILVADQPGVIGGPKKSLKTSIAVDLAISLGTGTPFLGKFEVPQPRRVAFFSGESGRATIRETARRVCAVKGLSLTDSDVIWYFDLPQLSVANDRRELRHLVERKKIDVLMIDPVYLCLLAMGKGAAATNMFEVGPILHRFTKASLEAGATPILVHHTTKNVDASSGTKTKNPKSPILTLDSLAFAGIGEFARQWMLIGRRSAFVPGIGRHELVMTVGGSAGHSGAWDVHIEEGMLKTGFTGRRWAVTVSK